jgi:hypothetical protein
VHNGPTILPDFCYQPSYLSLVVYSDAPGQNIHLGAAAVMLNEDQEVVESRLFSVGSMTNSSVYATELIGIFYGISLVLET